MVTATPGGWGQFNSVSLSLFSAILVDFIHLNTERNTEKTQERKRDTNLGLADLIQEIVLECSWCVWRVIKRMDLRQKDKEKAKEKEKEVTPGDRTPKVRGVAKSNRTRPRVITV